MGRQIGLERELRAVVAGLASMVGPEPGPERGPAARPDLGAGAGAGVGAGAGAGAGLRREASATLARWRRAGLGLAVVADRSVPAAWTEGLAAEVDAVVAGPLELEPLARRRAALDRLGVSPGQAVAIEGELAGIAAARQLGFARVIAVEASPRVGPLASLVEAGADRVVGGLARVRFPRVLASALDHVGELREQLGGRRPALFLDFDGTLTPIVRDPARVGLDSAARARLAQLAERLPVAILSGRDRADLEARVGIPGLVYAGSHGFDIAGAGLRQTLAEAEAARPRLAEAERRLEAALAAIPGVILERKRYGLAIHDRQVVGEARIEAVRRVVDAVGEATGLRQRGGKRVRELVPPVSWDKGRAMAWILAARGLDEHALIVVGDDETDEDAFAELRRGARVGVGIRVGGPRSCSLADYRLADPREVRALLDWVGGLAEGRGQAH